MLKFGFAAEWVSLIMRCISSTHFSLLINGETKGLIHPSRGIRQGDLLSPYQFLFCAEGFSMLLHNATISGRNIRVSFA